MVKCGDRVEIVYTSRSIQSGRLNTTDCYSSCVGKHGTVKSVMRDKFNPKYQGAIIHLDGESDSRYFITEENGVYLDRAAKIN